MLRGFLCKVQYASIECIILQILEKSVMVVIRSTPGRECHVADLRELSVIVECCDLKFSDSFW
jgi:hypothetical protein